MKRVFSRITAAILIAGSLSACAPDPDLAQEPGAVRVLMPANNSKGEYSLGVSELKGIEDIYTVSGKYARFYMSPRITQDKLDGVAPKARFLRNDQGDYVPSDQMTQQLVTLYGHMQKLAALDVELGAEGVNQWPRSIGVAVRVRGHVTNNAFYDGKSDSMLFVPYTSSGLPIAINGGILAHEHFHSLFYKLALASPGSEVHTRSEFMGEKNLQLTRVSGRNGTLTAEEVKFFFNSIMSRGLNEGLADFWGWMYTGDPDFIAQSLPREKTNRSLDVEGLQASAVLPHVDVIKRSIFINYSNARKGQFDDYLVGYAYSVGTQFSRMLKRFTDIYSRNREIPSLEARKEIAKIIIKVLPKIGGDFYTSDNFVDDFVSQLNGLKKEECDFLARIKNELKDAKSSYEFSCTPDESNFKITFDILTPEKSEESLMAR